MLWTISSSSQLSANLSTTFYRNLCPELNDRVNFFQKGHKFVEDCIEFKFKAARTMHNVAELQRRFFEDFKGSVRVYYRVGGLDTGTIIL